VETFRWKDGITQKVLNVSNTIYKDQIHTYEKDVIRREDDVSIILPLQIVTFHLPIGKKDMPYFIPLKAVGGDGNFNWKKIDGNLPPELMLNETTGIISGIPIETGVFKFIVQVRDSGIHQQTDIKSLSIIVGVFIDDSKGGDVKTQDGKAEIKFDPHDIGKDSYVIIYSTPAIDLPSDPPGYYKIKNSAFKIEIYDEAGKPIKDFKNPITLIIHYPDENQDGVVDNTSPPLNEKSLGLYTLEEGDWQKTQYFVSDSEANKVSAELTCPSLYILIGRLLCALKLRDVAVYPNPFKPAEGHTHITFGHPTNTEKRLTEEATIKIYTLHGECVKVIEERDGDGVAEWDGRNEEGVSLGSGIYIYIITNPARQRCVGKIGIIR
jgi:hypothetical protein